MSKTKLQTEFSSKMDVVQCLVNEWGYRSSQFYNSSTNKSVEKFWTFNRCLQHLFDLRRNYVRIEDGRMRKDFYNNVYSK